MFRTPFQIVLGTHAATPVPAAARAHGFGERFALVQSTHSPASPDMVVDPVPLLALLRAADAHFQAAGQLYWDRVHRRRERLSLTALEAHYRDTPPEDHATLSAAQWRTGDRLVALLHTELWSNVGGPAPYHDSVTYSLYTPDDLSGPLLAALRRAGHDPTAVTRVAPPGRLLSPLQRLLAALRPTSASRK